MPQKIKYTGVHRGLTETEILALPSDEDLRGHLYIPSDNIDMVYKVDEQGDVRVDTKTDVIFVSYDSDELKVSDTRQEINPISGDWEVIRDMQGEIISNSSSPVVINRPFGLCRCESSNEIFMSDYGNKGGKIDPFSGSVLTELLPHTYGNPVNGNSAFAYASGIAISPDRSKYILVTYVRDVARVFSMTDGSLLSEIGLPSSPGNVADGKLNNPYGNPIFIDNNTVALSVFSGNTESSGGIFSYNISTSTAILLNTLMVGENTGSVLGSNFIDNPFDIVKIPNTDKALICEHGRNRLVEISDINLSTWGVDKIHYPPVGVTWTSLWGIDISQDGLEIAVLSQSRNEITCINRDTGSLVWQVNTKDFGYIDNRAVTFVDDNFVMIASYTNRGILLLPRKTSVDVSYTSILVPEKMIFDKVLTQVGNFNFNEGVNPTLSIDVNDLDKVNTLVALFNKE